MFSTLLPLVHFGKTMFADTTSNFTSYNITLMYSEPRLKIILKCRTYTLFLTQLAVDQVNHIKTSET